MSLTISDPANPTLITNVAQFHIGDNQTIASTANGLYTGSVPVLFNGVTFDREYNNYDTTTGDSGVKTVGTTNGAAQTNFNALGAYITAIASAVTGTLALQLQWSPDKGTTWLNVGPATSTIAAAGSICIAIFPTNISQTAGATPANLALGSTVTSAINAPLPRTWRVNMVVGTTSAAITGIYVNYIAP